MKGFIRLLLGNIVLEESTDYKYAILRIQFNLIIIFISIFYLWLDTYNGVSVFIPWYTGMLLTGILGIVLNRMGYYTITNAQIIILSNSVVFLFADTDSHYGGVFFYFIGCALTSQILFGYKYKYFGIACVILSIGLGLLAFFYNFSLVPPPKYDDVSTLINFISNFIIGSMTCAMIVYFLIRENFESEKKLIENQSQLIATTEELKINKERFEMAVMGSRAGIYEWSLLTNSIYVSSQWKELLGYNANELSSISIDQFISFIHPEDGATTHQKTQNVLKTLESYQSEVRIRTKSGKYKWFLDSGIVKPGFNNQAEFVIGSLIDIDDRKKAESEITLKNIQLAKTNEELDRFVYSASHDMRAPLSSLLGLINLSEKTDAIEDFRIYHGMMKERIKVMEGFIKEVTDYSRNTRLDLVLTKHALRTIVNEVVDNLAYSYTNKKLKVEIDIDPSLSITTDVSRLKVVLNNLISNSYKYQRLVEDYPFIKIAGQLSSNNTFVVSVSDNGTGISAAHHHRIFDMFYRASENSEGSGLGLYIVKETLQKLGGDIQVESTEGKGSIFSFSLPTHS